MTTSPPFLSSLINIPNSKLTNHDVGLLKFKSFVRENPFSTHFHPINSVGKSPSSSGSRISATITNSSTLDHDSVSDEGLKAESRIGARVRVKEPVKVYHVAKVPELDLTGKIGVLKQYVGVHNGKKISANLPYKVEFVADEVLGRDGKPVKFTAHLREDEFEFLD
ncbi:Ferredoxin-thioredoxin reductase, variable chain [Sesamum alatum]|uniref:Ferredoxin-thioredoxin reductase, variable chain n=1 Tax=Sesamum alatum TaxID=300844 RepID=A0AAE1XM92_9LAMI|nr:Ferredoxin-thioredoxin reductase, variable chain [Sesamum alatum]